jgi:NADPH:quinone reductase-like Zn-dependent oxidoreductase
MLHAAGRVDSQGYMTHALGYDAPGQMGCLATRMRLKGRQLIPVPDGSRHGAPQWAAFAVRYVTAWANWRVARAVARLFHDPDAQPALNVWGWGGGTTLAELDLARREGHRTAMLAGRDSSLAAIAALGIDPVDRRPFGSLRADPDAGAAGAEQRRAYRAQLRAFTAEVQRRTGGQGVQVFADYIGEPVWRATLRALSRQGVLTTAGWKHGMRLDFLRAAECIAQRQFVHTHFAPRAQAVQAMAYGEARGWLPPAPARVYSFDEIPQLADEYEAGAVGYFPCFAIDA